MNFSSDNTSPVPNQILDKIKGANDGHQASYGEDEYMCELNDRIKDIFETEEARVYLVSTGTAANSLALACLSNPWDTIFCSPISHLHQDECNAPEFFTGGAKLTLVGHSDKISPEELNTAMLSEETRGIHGPQRGPVSITQITEKGRCYSLKEIHQISEVKSKFKSQLHMDGARFANALSALNCSPAEMTWMAGVDAVTFGCTKNGLMGVEAVIFFSSEHAREFELRRKRAGHLFSKNRYLAAQMLGYLDNNLWLELAKSSNKMAKKLSKLLGILPYVKLHHETEANMIFADMPRKAHQELFNSGAKYYLRNGFLEGDLDEFVTGRFVCSWSTTEEDIKAFITAAKKVNC